ncbi:hypothetical protein ES332_A13G187500v1 [Gossypium tomentosum]|uniref:Uncharacterized protein n=1 Tax=Gossypium tomentosum TaxID=34277 RepID=A0A5D2MLY6_GOSTO|nr:hypothetical protein ES332_A13G187500v1 [Gossypium tomentosum]
MGTKEPKNLNQIRNPRVFETSVPQQLRRQQPTYAPATPATLPPYLQKKTSKGQTRQQKKNRTKRLYFSLLYFYYLAIKPFFYFDCRGEQKTTNAYYTRRLNRKYSKAIFEKVISVLIAAISFYLVIYFFKSFIIAFRK